MLILYPIFSFFDKENFEGVVMARKLHVSFEGVLGLSV